MTDETDKFKNLKGTPVEPQDFTHGAWVVDIGDARVAKGMTRRPTRGCPHKDVVYDSQERRVWCNQCESEIEPYDAFKMLVDTFDTATRRMDRRERELKEAESALLVSRAAKAMDKAWRQKKMVPCCVACGSGMLPEDYTKVGTMISKEWALAEKKRRGK